MLASVQNSLKLRDEHFKVTKGSRFILARSIKFFQWSCMLCVM